MIIALTGTPGTGKTSVSRILTDNNFRVIDLNEIAIKKGFIIGNDKSRDSKIIDIKRLDEFVLNSYGDEDIVFIEGHLSHLLKNVDKVIIFRCHPDKLGYRLSFKKWGKNKIKENIEAEILDVILCETVDVHLKRNIFEIDTTKESVKDIALIIIGIIDNGFRNVKKYSVGNIDWSEEILKDFK